MAIFKLSKDGKLKLIYKEEEKTIYLVCKRSGKYVEELGYCVSANTTAVLARISVDASMTTCSRELWLERGRKKKIGDV